MSCMSLNRAILCHYKYISEIKETFWGIIMFDYNANFTVAPLCVVIALPMTILRLKQLTLFLNNLYTNPGSMPFIAILRRDPSTAFIDSVGL